MAKQHEAWLWAAYKLGEWPDMPEGLPQGEFLVALYRHLEAFQFAYVLRAPNEKGPTTPVGLVVAKWRDGEFEIHAHWFPWATNRNVFETALHFLQEMRKRYWLLVIVQEKAVRFYDRMEDYGVLRKIGHAYNMPRWPGEKVMLYQGERV